jgi:hypothetical protein
MKVRLIYFKESGKYYSEGSYESSCAFQWEIYKEVRQMKDDNNLPGVVNSSWHVLIEAGLEPIPQLIIHEF